MQRDLRFFLCLYLSFIGVNICFSQSLKGFKTPDSLKNKNYEQLERSFSTTFQSDPALLYANTFLVKAKKENNIKRIVDGYFLHFLKSEKNLKYTDSIRTAIKNKSIGDLSYGYFKTGDIYYNAGLYNQALTSYLSALEYAKKNDDQKSIVLIKNAIGDIKYTTNDYDEAIKIFRQNYEYIKDREKEDPNNYLSILFSLTNTYNSVKKYDSAYIYGNIGKSKSILYDKKYYTRMFDLSNHVTEYYLKKYQQSVTGLKDNIEFFKKFGIGNLQVTYMYLSMNFHEIHDEPQYLYYFNKLDSLQKVTNNVDKNLIGLYENTLNHYKLKDDKEKQLYLVNRLIELNKTIYESNYAFSKEIHQKYDTPELLEQKEKLITNLSLQNTVLYWWLGGGFLLLCLFVYLYTVNRKKMKHYRIKAQKLVSHSKEIHSTAISHPVSAPEPVQPSIAAAELEASLENNQEDGNNEAKNQIPLSVKQSIITKLENFENQQLFTSKNITLYSLARDFETNRDYLSKIINELKGKNFSQYLNELRINFVVKELKENKKLRLKTIAAIAEDIGFNNAESFTRAFKQVTDTLPSYYIKALREDA
ncbi:helix-turn-helix domain-containing protein [Chryseobacterium sp.]|uniref:helix-turn-helix domain-containing protein n=1 Tax=Chryseobacterium sp. TaxID=1871047 RepID=UPI0025B9736C|nr:helix-turn-helix domain-containing protein [Chryseobacterium sp.]MBV8324990.1 helix-turn-helix domain-containing protein [Chryseobacterium sp.]